MKPTKKACDMTTAELAAYIDQSVLKPEFSQAEIRQFIQEGIDYRCKTVCINPSALPIAKEMCAGTGTEVCVVCDFPFGLSSTESKAAQADLICRAGGVSDLDIVANYGWIRSGLWDAVERDIKAVADVCHSYGVILKVIFETDALTLDEVAKATDAACRAGADFVKTSTGFFTGSANRGAAPDVVQVMLDASQGRCRVKGSGGIRSREQFFTLIDMGVDRMGIGCRSTPVLLGVDGGSIPSGTRY